MLADHASTEYVNLLRGIKRGDCDAIKNLLARFLNIFDGVIFLHVASVAGHLGIVEKLFKIVREDYMNDYLEIEDENGDTGLSFSSCF